VQLRPSLTLDRLAPSLGSPAMDLPAGVGSASMSGGWPERGSRKIARGGETKAERHDGGVGSRNECDGEHDAAAAVCAAAAAVSRGMNAIGERAVCAFVG
jgi:hypothetical protein